MTDEQQAVPVAQEDRDAAARELQELDYRRRYARFLKSKSSASMSSDMEYAFHWNDAPDFIKAERYEEADVVLASLPCKSGEGAGEALEIAKAALENYADPTGYCDQDGEQFKADEKVHPGLLAAETLARITALNQAVPVTAGMVAYARAEIGNLSRQEPDMRLDGLCDEEIEGILRAALNARGGA